LAHRMCALCRFQPWLVDSLSEKGMALSNQFYFFVPLLLPRHGLNHRIFRVTKRRLLNNWHPMHHVPQPLRNSDE
jgi:hypothetical protein